MIEQNNGVEPSNLKEFLDKQPMHDYMRRYALANSSVGVLTYRMLKRESKSWQTLRRYYEAIERFSVFMKVGKDADKALDLLRKNKNPTDIIDEFIGSLQDSNLTPVSIKSMFFGVKKWLVANRVQIDWNYIPRPKVSSRIRDRIPDRDELRRIFKGAKHRDTALFLTALSSGLRIGTAVRLKIKDVEWLPEHNVAKIEVQGGSGKKLGEGSWYFTFITSEAYQAIQDYLATRQNKEPDDYLFATLNDEKAFYIYTNNVAREWRRLVRKAGLLKKIENHGWTELHTHTLRKYFQTWCKTAGISPSYYDFWMGHVNMRVETNLDDSYFRAEIPKHIEQYKKALPDLTIFQDLKTNEDIGKLKVEIEEIREESMNYQALSISAMQALAHFVNATKTKDQTLLNQAAEEIKKVYDVGMQLSEESMQRLSPEEREFVEKKLLESKQRRAKVS